MSVLLQPNTCLSTGSGGPPALVVSQKQFFVEKSYGTQAIQAFTSFVANLFYSEKKIVDLQSGAGTEWKRSGIPGVRDWDTTKMLHLGKTEIFKCAVQIVKQLPVDLVSPLTPQLCYIYGCSTCSFTVMHRSIHLGKQK